MNVLSAVSTKSVKPTASNAFVRVVLAFCFAVALALAAGVFATQAYAAELPASGTYDSVPWAISAEGELTIGEEGQTHSYGRVENAWTKSRTYNTWPWYEYRDSIKSVKVLGTVQGYGSHYGMFYGMKNLVSADLSGFNTGSIWSFTSMFSGCNSLASLDVSTFNTSRALYMQQMFAGCYALTSLDVSNFDTSKVTTMQGMFAWCSNLETLNVSGLDTSQVTDMSLMFYACNELKELDVSGFNTSNVVNMDRMFGSLFSIEHLDVSNFNTSKVTDFKYMFHDCLKLKALDVSKWDTSSATTMDSMFSGCMKVEELDVSGFNTANVESMASMFSGCGSLKKLDISNFDTSSLYNVSSMLYGLSKLEEIVLGDFSISGTGFSSAGGYWTSFTGTDEETAEQLERLYEHEKGRVYYRTLVEGLDEPLYWAVGLGANNMWEVHTPEDHFQGYCLNQHRATANGPYDKVLVDSDQILISELLDANSYGYEPIGSSLREALIALIYWAEAEGFYQQVDIWHFTNSYATGAYDKDTTGHTYADIPEADSYVLYLYKSRLGNQNLLTIEGLNKQAYGGVVVHKLDNYQSPVAGVEFTIYSGGIPVRTVVSNEDGMAGVFRMSEGEGLPLGTYTIEETAVPRGYNRSTQVYEFSVTQDQQLVSVSTSGAAMTFVNQKNNEVGGGIAVKKTDETGNPLASAEFTIFAPNGAAVKKIYSDQDGYAMTGPKDLELGVEYTLRETKAPAGYELSAQEITFTLIENGQFWQENGENVAFTNTSKTGTCNLEVQKVLEGGQNLAGFTFVLKNAEGKEIARAITGENGKASFSKHIFTAADLGYATYTISELETNAAGYIYDTHVAEVTVVVEDNGGESLDCYPIWADEDSATFENKVRRAVHFSKVDILGEEIAGAQVQILNAAGEVVEEWISDGTQHITRLVPGTYAFHEVVAPAGMAVATDITFTVNKEGLATIDGQDAPAANNTIAMEDAYLPITTNIQVQKQLEGRSLAAGEFSFTLVADAAEYANGEKGTSPAPAATTATNAADGLVTFGPIEFDRPGTYTYTVRETVPTGAQLAPDGTTPVANGVAYSQAVHEVSIEVVRDASVGLVATVVDDAHEGQLATFENVYIANKAVATLVATKALVGADLEEGAFEFELYEGEEAIGTPIDTVSNTASGQVAFDVLSFGEAGQYAYTIVEKNTGKEGYTYDETAYTVVVGVADNGEGSLVATVAYPEGGAVFENSYTEPEPESQPEPQPEPEPEPTPEPGEEPEEEPTPEPSPEPTPTPTQPVYAETSPVKVELVKHLIDARIHPEEFGFVLYDESGNQVGNVVRTTLGIRNTQDSQHASSYVDIVFEDEDLTYTKPGEYIYTIREYVEDATQVVEGDEWNLAGFEPGYYKAGVKYDEREYPVVVTVKENEQGELETSVAYPGSESGVELINEYSEEFIEIDGNTEHVNDWAEEDEPDNNSNTPKPTPTPTPAPKTDNPSPTAAPTTKTGPVRTADTNPVAALSLLALVAAGSTGVALVRRRKHE